MRLLEVTLMILMMTVMFRFNMNKKKEVSSKIETFFLITCKMYYFLINLITLRLSAEFISTK